MAKPRITASTKALEEVLADCVGTQPERVKMADWAGIARRMEMLLEQRGLRLAMIRPTPQDRFSIAGPIKRDETVVVLGTYNRQAIVKSAGAPMDTLPNSLAVHLWQEMFDDAMADMGRTGK